MFEKNQRTGHTIDFFGHTSISKPSRQQSNNPKTTFSQNKTFKITVRAAKEQAKPIFFNSTIKRPSKQHFEADQRTGHTIDFLSLDSTKYTSNKGLKNNVSSYTKGQGIP